MTTYAPSTDIPDQCEPDPREREAAYALVARAAARLQAGGLPLAGLAEEAGYSPGHFQRLFLQWMGLSPKRFQQYLAGRRAVAALRGDEDLLSASLAVGLSGPGRLHDLVVALSAASPGEVRSGGAGLEVSWGVAATPFGPAFLASSARGLMKLSFLGGGLRLGCRAGAGAGEGEAEGSDVATTLAELRAEWPAAGLARDDAAAAALVRRLFASYRAPAPVGLFVKGTQFQLRVWEALLRVPEGGLTTYGELAADMNLPGASRAVGNAVGANPVALLIPCHRVIRASGALGGYRWGEERKQLLLAAEQAWSERLSGAALSKE